MRRRFSISETVAKTKLALSTVKAIEDVDVKASEGVGVKANEEAAVEHRQELDAKAQPIRVDTKPNIVETGGSHEGNL